MKKQRQKLTGSQGHPSAWIAIHKNRQKAHSATIDQIYLKDKQEFQIELYNPTRFSVLVKIKIGGSYISNRGLILDPGQRWFLARYIDSNKKFLFTTYDVEDSETTAFATAFNGLVEVEFYNEMQKIGGYNHNQPYWFNDWNKPYVAYTHDTTANPIIFATTGFTTTTTGGSITSNHADTGTQMINSNITSSYFSDNAENVSNTATFDSMETIETGKVGEGETSTQSFEEGHGNFNSYATYTTRFKLMPISTKPVTKNEMRNYCPNCSARIRKSSWKFCPNCGENTQCC